MRGNPKVPTKPNVPYKESRRRVRINAVNATPGTAGPRPSGGAKLSRQIAPAGQGKRGRSHSRQGILIEAPGEEARGLAKPSGSTKGRSHKAWTARRSSRGIAGGRVEMDEVHRHEAGAECGQVLDAGAKWRRDDQRQLARRHTTHSRSYQAVRFWRPKHGRIRRPAATGNGRPGRSRGPGFLQ